MMKTNVKRKLFIVGIIILFQLIVCSFTLISNAETTTVVGSWDVSASDDMSNVTATLYSDGKMVISGTGKMKDYQSSSAQPYKDSKSSIKTVEINQEVTSIGNTAFYGCSSLTSITIPNSVTSIGDDAFSGCSSLTNITIPNSVTSIGDYAFNACSSLTSITIPSSVTSIGNGVFYKCGSLTSVTIPSSVTSIGSSAFEDCSSLTSITIPSSVTSIGDWAFYGCSSLTSIEIPSSVTSIGDGVFEDCSSLTSISVDINNQNYSSENGILFNKAKTELIQYPTGKKDTAYTIPNSVTSIGDYTFYRCSSLTSITIPSSVTSIGNYAFYRCSSLTSIEIPSSVTSIGDSAFKYCSSLTNIEIPDGVTSIGDEAFRGCSSLTSINVDINNQNYSSENGILFNKVKTELIQYPAEKKDTVYTIPNSVTSISRDAFAECSSLTSITIPSGVTSIGNYAFYRCSSLTSIEIPSSVTSISRDAFAECSSLTSIEIPDGVTNIGDDAFDGCSSLTSIEIPDGVTNIGGYAFYGCSSLTSITIPSSVTSIGDDAFSRAKLTMAVATGTETVQEMELPDVIKRAMNEEDILYTANDFTLTNCSLSEDKTKLVVDTEVASTKTVSLKVTEGALNGLTVVVVPSGTITYSTTSWTKNDVIARIYIANGETIQNNEGKNTYTFTENGTFTFQYLTEEGEVKEATATVENIEELTIENYKVTEENGTKYIESIKPGTSIQEVLNNIKTNGTAKVYQDTTKITEGSTKAGTGMTIKVEWGTTDEESYTIIVTGDLNGDGKIGDIDLLRLARYNAGLDKNLEGAYLKAADVYADGNYADGKDLLKMARVLAGLDSL